MPNGDLVIDCEAERRAPAKKAATAKLQAPTGLSRSALGVTEIHGSFPIS